MGITLEALQREYSLLDNLEYKWLYINNWYDGPIEGLIETSQGSHLYARLVDEDDDDSRVYSLTELDPESAAYEAQKQLDFETYVGSHWSFIGENRMGTVKPQTEWHKFYSKYDWKTDRPLTGKIIGWIKE